MKMPGRRSLINRRGNPHGITMSGLTKTYRDWPVFQMAMTASMDLFEATKSFPKEERFAMTDQIRRASRSVCSNLVEAWGKRRYRLAFIAKLNDSESEALETQFWIEMALLCNYLDSETAKRLDKTYDRIIAQLVGLINSPERWIRKKPG